MDKSFKIHGVAHRSFWRKNSHLIMLSGIVMLSFFLNFFLISKTGYGNAYYAAAIRSMTQSFHNFFFVSFDPAGIISVDKPPVGLWVQAIFVLVFGYHGWAMLLPQALAGAASSLMLYVLTAKYFGKPAGLASALVFALTPAVVVAARNNTMDMQLVFVLLAATWFLFKAIELGKWRSLFTAALLIGIGFNIKMLQAYFILPAAALAYLIFSHEKIGRRIIGSIICFIIVLAVSLSWALAVDFTDSENRPFVGSSTDNTVMELIIGHNGLERLYGRGGNRSFGGRTQGAAMNGGQKSGNQITQPGAGGKQNPDADTSDRRTAGAPGFSRTSNRDLGQNQSMGNSGARDSARTHGRSGGSTDGSGFNSSMRQPGGRQGSARNSGGGTPGNNIGTAGALRLFGSSLYGQISWLLVLVLFGVGCCIHKVNIRQLTVRQAVWFYWVVWLATTGVFFSFAGYFHRYYLCMIAPGLAALAGIGFAAMMKAFCEHDGWRQWLLPLSLAATAAVAVARVWDYPAVRSWLVPVIVGSVLASLLLLAAARLCPGKRQFLMGAAFLAALSLLAGPAYWSLTAAIYVPENVTMPYAGPELASKITTPGMTPNQTAFTGTSGATLALEKYLVENYKDGSYLVVGRSSGDVAGFIIETGLPAVAYGGFIGNDSALTLERFKSLVAEGKITYFLASPGGGSGSELIAYVKENAKLIAASEYGGSGNSQLYLCSPI